MPKTPHFSFKPCFLFVLFGGNGKLSVNLDSLQVCVKWARAAAASSSICSAFFPFLFSLVRTLSQVQHASGFGVLSSSQSSGWHSPEGEGTSEVPCPAPQNSPDPCRRQHQDGGVSPAALTSPAARPAAPCANSHPCPLAPGEERFSTRFLSFFLFALFLLLSGGRSRKLFASLRDIWGAVT